jgi:hypothetical protein
MPSRRDLLRSGALLAGSGILAWPARASSARKLITVATYGGWDATFALDPKLGVPGIDGPDVDEDPDNPDDRESVRTFADIPVCVNDFKRPRVTSFFESWADRAVVVNGVSVAAIGHQASIRRVLTGSGTGNAPDLGAIVGARLGGSSPLGYADLANQSFLRGDAPPGDPSWTATAGRLGERDQLRVLIDPDWNPAPPVGGGFTYPLYRPTDKQRASIRSFVSSETSRFALGHNGETRMAQAALDAAESSLRARRLREQAVPTARGIVQGDSATLAQDALVAVDGLARGVWQSALIDSRLPWDTHVDEDTQHEMWDTAFDGLDVLMTALTDAGLVDDVLVVVISEMTRTPLRNAANGKDHWPWATAMLLGGGVQRGGTVSGATNSDQLGVEIDLETGQPDASGGVLSYTSLAAGILERLDVDPEEHFPSVAPFRGF